MNRTKALATSIYQTAFEALDPIETKEVLKANFALAEKLINLQKIKTDEMIAFKIAIVKALIFRGIPEEKQPSLIFEFDEIGKIEVQTSCNFLPEIFWKNLKITAQETENIDTVTACIVKALKPNDELFFENCITLGQFLMGEIGFGFGKPNEEKSGK